MKNKKEKGKTKRPTVANTAALLGSSFRVLTPSKHPLVVLCAAFGEQPGSEKCNLLLFPEVVVNGVCAL